MEVVLLRGWLLCGGVVKRVTERHKLKRNDIFSGLFIIFFFYVSRLFIVFVMFVFDFSSSSNFVYLYLLLLFLLLLLFYGFLFYFYFYLYMDFLKF